MYSRDKFRQQQEIEKKKQEQAKELFDEKNKRLKVIHSQFSENLNKYANQYKDQIKSNPQFRSEFNQLCQALGVDPMVSKKTLFSDLGFGNFYSELSTKILDICARKRKQNGGIMKMEDIISDFKSIHKQIITKDDIKRALDTIQELGGCSIIKQEYVCTVPVQFSSDISDLMATAEQEGFVSLKLMMKQGWDQERFDQKIQVLQKEGLVWADKKLPQNQVHYYFPSMLNTYILNQDRYTQRLKENI